jgi:putative membrane protein insertion efficiency factor
MPTDPIRPGPFSRLAVGAIHYYQRRLSGRLAGAGVACRYEPTCSRYGELAYLRFGVVWGSVLTAYRLFRCTPWGGHGWDPVPARRDGRPDPVGAPVHPEPAPGVCPVCARHHGGSFAGSGRARRAARRRTRGSRG